MTMAQPGPYVELQTVELLVVLPGNKETNTIYDIEILKARSHHHRK